MNIFGNIVHSYWIVSLEYIPMSEITRSKDKDIHASVDTLSKKGCIIPYLSRLISSLPTSSIIFFC